METMSKRNWQLGELTFADLVVIRGLLETPDGPITEKGREWLAHQKGGYVKPVLERISADVVAEMIQAGQ